jgi:hypothetical protein
MSTPEINRANAQDSTGPKTPEGKQRSSLNALRHGLTGQIVVMPSEDLAAYQLYVKTFNDQFHPQGVIEAHLVQELADTSWRLSRIAALETNLISLGAATGTSPLSGAEEVQQAMSIADAVQRHAKTMTSLGMHGNRLSRQFERVAAQLSALQNTRLEQEQIELDQFLDITEMCEDTKEPYDPAADGFVFSEAQIQSATRARNRQRRAEKAFNHRRAVA